MFLLISQLMGKGCSGGNVLNAKNILKLSQVPGFIRPIVIALIVIMKEKVIPSGLLIRWRMLRVLH